MNTPESTLEPLQNSESAGVGNTFTLQMHAGIGGSWKAPNPKTVAKRAFRYSLRIPLW